MDKFTGILAINGDQSSLNGNLLVKAGISDPAQAISAATAYLLNNGFHNGSFIIVLGTQGSVGNVNVIIMSSALHPAADADFALGLSKAKLLPGAGKKLKVEASSKRTGNRRQKAPE
jgi:hypothetical protein